MSVNPLQNTSTISRGEAAPPAEDDGFNVYSKFAEIYDVFGSEEFCLAMTTHLMEAIDRYDLEDGARCVDLACGTGVITTELARYGFQVLGVDRSPHMLRYAAQRAERAGVNVEFLEMDMREFALEEQVPWIICTHDSLDHLYEHADLDRAFGRIAGALSENGLFMFDMNSWAGIRHLEGKTVFVETADCSGAYYLTAQDQTLRTSIVGFIRKEGNLYERFDETLLQRCYSNEEIRASLEGNGFIVRECLTVQKLKGDVFKQLWICQLPGPERAVPEVI